eukprot:10449578-Alexandrium_andersonii.AAC.1
MPRNPEPGCPISCPGAACRAIRTDPLGFAAFKESLKRQTRSILYSDDPARIPPDGHHRSLPKAYQRDARRP